MANRYEENRESMTPFITPPQDFTGDREALYRLTRKTRRVGSTEATRDAAETERTRPQTNEATFPSAPAPKPIGVDPLAARRAAVAQQNQRFTNPAMSPAQNDESIAANRARMAARTLDPFAGMSRTREGAIQTPYGTVARNWQAELVAKHPDLGQKDSPANQAFVATYRKTGDRNQALAAANLAREGFVTQS